MDNVTFQMRLQQALREGHNIGAAVRVEWDGKYLLLRRSQTDKGAGVYEMPGGSIDDGEELAAAAARELAEETGISIDPAEFEPLGIFEFHNVETNKHKVKFAFRVVLDQEPEITLSPEHDDFTFVTREEIEAMPRQGKDADYKLWGDHYEMLVL